MDLNDISISRLEKEITAMRRDVRDLVKYRTALRKIQVYLSGIDNQDMVLDALVKNGLGK